MFFGQYECNVGKISNLESLVLKLGGRNALDSYESDLWEMVRYSDNPMIDSANYELLFSYLSNYVMEEFGVAEEDISYYANCYDSSFSVRYDGDYYSLMNIDDYEYFKHIFENVCNVA